MNRSHVAQVVPAVRRHCQAALGGVPPEFVVVTRGGAEGLAGYGISADHITRDWREADRMALRAVRASMSLDDQQQEESPRPAGQEDSNDVTAPLLPIRARVPTQKTAWCPCCSGLSHCAIL